MVPSAYGDVANGLLKVDFCVDIDISNQQFLFGIPFNEDDRPLGSILRPPDYGHGGEHVYIYMYLPACTHACADVHIRTCTAYGYIHMYTRFRQHTQIRIRKHMLRSQSFPKVGTLAGALIGGLLVSRLRLMVQGVV